MIRLVSLLSCICKPRPSTLTFVGDDQAWRRCSKSLGEKGKRSKTAETTASSQTSLVPGIKRKRDLTGSPSADRTGHSANYTGIPTSLNIGTGIDTGMLRFQPTLGRTSSASLDAYNANTQGAAFLGFNTPTTHANLHSSISMGTNTMPSPTLHQSTELNPQSHSLVSQPGNPNLALIQQIMQQQQPRQRNNPHQAHAQPLENNEQLQLSNQLPTAAELLAQNVFQSSDSSNTDQS